MDTCKLSCDTNGPEWAFRSLTRAHHIAQNSVFDKLGIKDIGQPVMLFILSDYKALGKTCTQKELAKAMHLSPSTVTISIKSLERRGYIRRYTDQNDKRCNIVEITDEGVCIAQSCRQGFDGIDSAMYAGFSSEELNLITELFHRITANLLKIIEEGD